MASVFSKNAIFNVSKAFPQSSSLPLHRKASRVCFTYASKSSEEPNAAQRGEERRYYAGNSAKDVEDRVSETTEKAKENLKKSTEKTQEQANETKEKAKEKASRTAEMAHDTKEKAKERAQDMKEKTKGTAGTAADKAKEGTYRAAETAKEGTSKAAETAQIIGEKAKQTVQGAWGVAKETTQKIKETVVGKSEDVDDYMEDHVKKTMDEDDVEMRGRAARERGGKKN
ncbi:late embryogenesis abundant protein 19-like [Cornus florida]|uniref:late embryogenesis abundant protein 19-like n=1 Tax=Cornus florida TaxID=4283 RepID=UPI00289F8F72|nr:late embryogenesis abundant protein 19-like [Cornus florida]